MKIDLSGDHFIFAQCWRFAEVRLALTPDARAKQLAPGQVPHGSPGYGTEILRYEAEKAQGHELEGKAEPVVRATQLADGLAVAIRECEIGREVGAGDMARAYPFAYDVLALTPWPPW